MENTSKALIIVAAMLISVMILSLMMYLFGQAARVPASYEETKQEEMVLEFNSKFEGYAKVADFTGTGGNPDGKIDDSKLVNSLTGSETSEINNPSNTISEVISACNAAYDVNDRNGNDRSNSVTIDIVMRINGTNKYYSVVPLADAYGNSILKKDCVFEKKSTEVVASTTQVNLYDLLEITDSDGDKLTAIREFDDAAKKIYGLKYKYYFDGVVEYGEDNKFSNFGKITKVTFTLKENALY